MAMSCIMQQHYNNFAPFLAEGVTWLKKMKAQPLRGFEDNGEDIAAPKRLTAQQKASFLELMLGQIVTTVQLFQGAL